jgi:hypothetical protein
MELDLRDTPSTKAKEHGAQAGDRSVDKTQEPNTQKLSQVNSELLSLRSRLDHAAGSATLDVLIRGTSLSQCVFDGTTASLIEDILHSTSKFLDVLGP